MPIVPTYGPRKVTTAPLPGVRKQAHETALSEGAGLAGAQAQRSEAMGNFGGVAANVGAQMWEQETRRADEVAMTEAENKLARWENDRIYNPETGALTVKGKDAMPLAGQVGQEFDQMAGEIEQGLTNNRQRQAFARIKGNHAIRLDGTLKRHTFEQVQAFDKSELDSFIENKRNSAIVNAGDPQQVNQDLTDAVAKFKAHAPRFGYGSQRIDEDVGKIRTATYEGVIDRQIADNKLPGARAYYDEASGAGQLSGEALTRIKAKLETAETAKTGLDAATELWTKLGPPPDSDTAPINLDTMETAAREQFKDDPKAFEQTIRFLRERKAGVDASRQDRLEQRSGPLWLAASQGATLADVTHRPEFLALPPKAQAAISDHIVQRAEHDANRKYADEGRAYTERQRGQATLEQKGWARYWELSQPESLNKLSDNALNMMRGDLGDDHVNRLIEQKRKLGAAGDKVHAASIDDDLFKTVAQSAGLKAYGSSTDEQKADLGQLKNAVETEIDREQQKTGKPLGREQKQAIMQSVVDRKVMLDVWGRDDTKVAAIVTNRQDAEKAYVPVEQIPQRSLNEWINVVRSQSPSAQRLSREEILSQWGDRIQRAHAAHVLRLGSDEEMRRLQGR